MKFLSCSIFFISLVFFSCKKEDSKKETSSTSTDNQTNKIRLSCDFRYQPVTEPIYIRSLTPHLQLISWDEVYEEWDDNDDLKYYWEKFDLKIINEIEEDRRIN